jgi:ATP-dependent RNA helicase DHX8/PRP22
MQNSSSTQRCPPAFLDHPSTYLRPPFLVIASSLLTTVCPSCIHAYRVHPSAHPFILFYPSSIILQATVDGAAMRITVMYSNQVLHVPGRRFPVKVMYTSEPQPDVLDATIVAVLQIHLEEPSGDILVFMTGQDQIEDAAKVIRERGRALPPSADKLLPCPLYAAMPPAQQLLAFEPAPAGTRKVILATNIAESSITVEGIMYVVDGGLVKARIYDPKMDMDLLHEVPVSKVWHP